LMLEELRRRWWRRVRERRLEGEKLTVEARPLKPEEAIGKPARGDYPLLKGKEVMIEARVRDARGQAFTDEPSNYSGSLASLMRLPLDVNKQRAVVVAGINATYSLLGLIKGSRHCRDDGPELCARRIGEFLSEDIGTNVKLGMIGFQPAIAEHLSRIFRNFRITDMDEENWGRRIGKAVVEPHVRNHELIEWSDALLVTGTTIVNDTIDEIISLSRGKKLYFYGVTIASAAYEFGLRRLCFTSS